MSGESIEPNPDELEITPNPYEANFLPSEDLKRAFESLEAHTHPKKEAIEHKRTIVKEISERNLIDPAILKSAPVIYVGSNIDFEYPLVLGSREIYMIDPVFREDQSLGSLKGRIQGLVGDNWRQEQDGSIHFKFDFGEGEEEVILRPQAALYGSPEKVSADQPDIEEIRGRIEKQLEGNPDDIFVTSKVKDDLKNKTGIFSPDYVPEEKFPRFEPPTEIGLLLGFQTAGVDLDSDPESLGNLVSGGYIFVNNVLDSFISSLTEEETDDYIYGDKPTIAIMKQKWNERSFDFIPLNSEGGSYSYTFVRKK